MKFIRVLYCVGYCWLGVVYLGGVWEFGYIFCCWFYGRFGCVVDKYGVGSVLCEGWFFDWGVVGWFVGWWMVNFGGYVVGGLFFLDGCFYFGEWVVEGYGGVEWCVFLFGNWVRVVVWVEIWWCVWSWGRFLFSCLVDIGVMLCVRGVFFGLLLIKVELLCMICWLCSFFDVDWIVG